MLAGEADERKARHRRADAHPARGPPVQCRRRRPGPRAGRGRSRHEPADQDLRDRSTPTARSSAPPRPVTSPTRPTARARTARSPSPTNCRVPPSARPMAAPPKPARPPRKPPTSKSPRPPQTELTQAGGVKRLSIAVVVDGTYTTDAAGQLHLRAARPGDPRPVDPDRPLRRRLRRDTRRPGPGRQPAVRRPARAGARRHHGPRPLRLHPRRPDERRRRWP